MIKEGEVGPKPVGYLALAWVSGIGAALMLVGLIALIVAAYSGAFGGLTLQQALVGLIIALFVALTQVFLAQAGCFAILHSRSQRALLYDAIGTGSLTGSAVFALPFETDGPSRFWVALFRSGWRVLVAIYAMVLAVIVSAGTQSALPALPLVALAVALGFWHASYVPKKRARTLAKQAADDVETARIDKALDAKQLRLERQFARAEGASITQEWIERELKKAFTATAIKAVQGGDLAALDKPVLRAHRAMNERVPVDQLREKALAWVGEQPRVS